MKFWLKLLTSLHSSKSLSILAQQPKETKISASSPNKNPCAGYKKTSHPSGPINQRYCLAAKLLYDCRIRGHLKKVCQKSAKVGIKTTNRSIRCETECASLTFSNTSLKVSPLLYAMLGDQHGAIKLVWHHLEWCLRSTVITDNRRDHNA